MCNISRQHRLRNIFSIRKLANPQSILDFYKYSSLGGSFRLPNTSPIYILYCYLYLALLRNKPPLLSTLGVIKISSCVIRGIMHSMSLGKTTVARNKGLLILSSRPHGEHKCGNNQQTGVLEEASIPRTTTRTPANAPFLEILGTFPPHIRAAFIMTGDCPDQLCSFLFMFYSGKSMLTYCYASA